MESVVVAAATLGLRMTGAAEAGVPGPKGNREVFVRLGRGASEATQSAESMIAEAVS